MNYLRQFYKERHIKVSEVEVATIKEYKNILAEGRKLTASLQTGKFPPFFIKGGESNGN